MDAVLTNTCVFERHTYKNHIGIDSPSNSGGGGGDLPFAYQSKAWLGAQKSQLPFLQEPSKWLQETQIRPQKLSVYIGLGT